MPLPPQNNKEPLAIRAACIDPGVGGAVALRIGETARVFKVKDWTRLDYITFFRRFGPLPAVMLERVGPMPHDGRKSLWTFASNVERWKCALTDADVPFFEVSPQKWQGSLGLTLSKEKAVRKRQIKDLVEARWPGVPATLWSADALAMLMVYKEFI